MSHDNPFGNTDTTQPQRLFRPFRYKLIEMQAFCGASTVPTATVTIFDVEADAVFTRAATGTGPVDAAYEAIKGIVKEGENISLLEYTVTENQYYTLHQLDFLRCVSRLVNRSVR